MHNVPKWSDTLVRRISKVLQNLLQDFWSVSDHFGTLCIKGLKLITLAWKGLILPAGIHLPKVNNKSTRTRCEIRSKLTINISERCQWRHFGVFNVLTIKLWTYLTLFSSVFIIDYEQAMACWAILIKKLH